MVRVLLLLSIWCSMFMANEPQHNWTWVHRKNFTKHDRTINSHKRTLLFTQENLIPFTQLVFSWNALRPQEGYFSFYVQVRDFATKKWGIWHHMVDWGKDIQCTYLSKTDGYSSHIHVRLEVENKKSSDAFRIKVEPHKGALLSLIHGLVVTLSDFNLFKSESHKNNDMLSSVYLSDIPTMAQLALEHEDKGRMCSPVSCSMMVQYIMGQYNDPLLFAAQVFDTGLGVYGSWGCNMAHAFDYCRGKYYFFVRRMNGFIDIHQQLIKGLPVVVSVRGNLPGALKPFPHGHLMVVVGWDNITREVLCHDPASESNDDVFKRYPVEHFIRAWECSHRLTYIAEPIKLK